MIADAERIAPFVGEHSPLAFCPPCIGRRLRLDIEAATLAVAEVGLRAGYGFKVGACSHCAKTDLLLMVEVVALNRRPLLAEDLRIDALRVLRLQICVGDPAGD